MSHVLSCRKRSTIKEKSSTFWLLNVANKGPLFKQKLSEKFKPHAFKQK